MSTNRRPLDGIVVLDLSQALSGPACTCILADYGARVIKIERTIGKEMSRGINSNPNLEMDIINGGDSFNAINRNKDSICLNLRTDEGKMIMNRLIEKADIIVSNYRPGTTKNMGIDYESAKKINPRIICCEIAAFSEKGRERDAGFDVAVQAASGVLASTGYPDQPPAKVGPSVTDVVAGLFMVQGVMFALYEREKTGHGQAVNVCMQDAAMFLFLQYVTPLLTIPDFDVTRHGMCHFEATPSDGFETSDGYVVTAPASDALFAKFCDAIGKPEMKDDPRFTGSVAREANRPQLYDIIKPMFKSNTTEYWFNLLNDAGLPASPISTPKQAFTKAMNDNQPIVSTVQHRKFGELPVVGTVVRLSETPGHVDKPAPRLGQDTEEVLINMAGLTPEEIAEYESRQIVKCLRD